MPHEIAPTLSTIGSSAIVLAASSLSTAIRSATHAPEIDAVRERVAALLSPTPVSRDELVRAAGAPAAVVFAALVELTLAGRAELLPGGLVAGL